MRELAKIALVGLIIAAASWSALRPRDEGGLPAGSSAPPLRLERSAGGEWTLEALRGRLVLLNFWATWCQPCIEELASLQGLHRELDGEGLSVVTVAVDDDGEALRRFVRARGLELTVLHDPGGRLAAAAYRVRGYPTTFFIDRQGVVREVYTGPAQWDTPGALAFFRRRLRP